MTSARLIWTGGAAPRAADVFPLTKRRTIVGRHPDPADPRAPAWPSGEAGPGEDVAYVAIAEPRLGRRHFEIERRDDPAGEASFWVRDLQSPSGTYVNHEIVREWRSLADGDDLLLGFFRFEVGR